ncbi:MAG TPA: hypothetical protein IGR15_09580 [Synechococcus sp. M44_DOE_062]|nr:hypothetical protein [Synechococcus sp. M44_DOE_062]
MVILDYASADHDHVAVTREGFWEAIRFQNHFYVLNRSFSRLQEAIDSCRYDMDRRSLISLVVVRPRSYEVWSQVGSDIPVLPKQLLSPTARNSLLPARSVPSWPKRPFWSFWPCGSKAYVVDGEPAAPQPLFHHSPRPYNALQA